MQKLASLIRYHNHPFSRVRFSHGNGTDESESTTVGAVKMMNTQLTNKKKKPVRKFLKYCKFNRKGICKFGDYCHFIRNPAVILRCPFGDKCKHDVCWYTHTGRSSSLKTEEVFTEVYELKKHLALLESQSVCVFVPIIRGRVMP